jgi:protein tyrosine/serine phosphatase
MFILSKRGPATRRRLLVTTAIAAGGTLAAVLLFLFYIGVFTGNIRTVVPGRVYRSGTLSPAQLQQLIREGGVRTVISLRGGDATEPWFRREAEVCRKEGVQLRTLRLRATVLPRPAELARLLELFDHSPYPVLFHCQGGADRSGLAAALYLHLYERRPLARAVEEGLTWRYGHFPLKAAAMDHFFDLYRAEGAGEDLRTWIRSGYEKVYSRLRTDKYFRKNGERVETGSRRSPGLAPVA